MKNRLVHEVLNIRLLTQLIGILSVVLFVIVVMLLIIPYTVIKMLACYTPVGKVPMPVSLQ